MEKSLKKQIKKYIALALVAAIVVLLAILPMLASEKAEDNGPQASILSEEVQLRNISTVVKGGGTLEEEEKVELTIPSGVKLKSFLVDNDDYVQEGDPVAEVDRVSVMGAISQVQETLEYLNGQIEKSRDAKISDTIKATAGGRVKCVYGSVGDSVRDVMLEYGALAVLSLDDLMAVEFQTKAAVSAGDQVLVTFEDGTKTDGNVESSLDGTVVVTVEDEGFQSGVQVTVSAEEQELGAGELYIHSQWNVTGISGTISKVHVRENMKVSAGKNIFSLKDVSFEAERQTLLGQRQKYEELMLELFRMYQDTTVNAPGEGLISGVEKDSAFLLSDSGSHGWTLDFLTNGPALTEGFTNFLSKIAYAEDGNWVLNYNSTPVEVTDYAAFAATYAGSVFDTIFNYTHSNGVQIYALENGQWVILEPADIGVDDELLIVFDENGAVVWIIRLVDAVSEPENPKEEEVTPPAGDEIPGESTPPQETVPVPENPGVGNGMIPGGMGSMSGMAGGMMGGFLEEESYELYSLEKSVIMSVTAQEEMTLTITVDESDISKLQVGQEAKVRLDALRNDRFTGTIRELGATGENNGGSSKFTVTIVMERSKDMLAGMNATATIVLDTRENLPSIPVAAICEENGRTFVYTSYDAENDILGDPVDVELGISDGEHVEILSGLNEGERFWYAYYDTLDISTDTVPENYFDFPMTGM